MKKLVLFIVAVILFASIPFTASSIYYEGFIYTENDDGTVSIVDADVGLGGDIVIPSEIEGKKVTCIGNKAFYYNEKITSVTIPSTVTEICEEAFWGCEELVSLNLNDGLKIIGKSAFSNCDSLTEIIIPYSVEKIDNWAFFGCNNLQTAYVYSKAQSCGEYVFRECDSLEDIYLSGTFIRFGYNTFLRSKNLKNIYYQGEEGDLNTYESGIDKELVTIHYNYEHEGFHELEEEKSTTSILGGGDSSNGSPIVPVIVLLLVLAAAAVVIIVIKKKKK